MAIDGLKMRSIPLPPDPQPPALDGSSKDTGHESTPDNQREAVYINDLPKAPLGDPLVATMMKQSLLQATEARIHGENNSIDNQMKAANQKAQNLMDAATTQMTVGVSNQVATAAGGSTTAGRELADSLNRGNANLAPVNEDIQELMKELQTKRRDEDEIKGAVKNTEEYGDSQLKKAVQSLKDATDAVTKFGDH